MTFTVEKRLKCNELLGYHMNGNFQIFRVFFYKKHLKTYTLAKF